MVARTFFAIPTGPTRAQRASARSGEIGAVPSRLAHGVRLDVDEVLNRVHWPIEGTEEQRWPLPHVLDQFSQGVRSRTAYRTLSV